MAQAAYARKTASAAHLARPPAWSASDRLDARHRAGPGGAASIRSGPVLRPSQVPAHPVDLETASGALASPGQPLAPAVRADMEHRFDHDFGEVRVHSDTAADRAASSLGASAFTAGHHIAFASGRYAPQTPQGRRLLAHELAHVVHGSTATTKAGGIAPENSAGERGARVASDLMHSNPARGSLKNVLRNLGPLYAVHPETIVTKGTEVNKGLVGSPDWGAGQQGPPIGEVHVRTGEEIEVTGGRRIPDMIALEYSGALSAESKWLQFVWFEMVADTPSGLAHLAGSIPTSSGNLPFTTDPSTPARAVDNGGAAVPFYEAAFTNIRNSSSTTMFDAPGGGSATPLADSVFKAGVGATAVRFVGHFDTFLIQRDQAMYRVSYSATTAFTQVGGATVAGAIGYSVLGTTGPVTSLPADLATLLHNRFPAYTNVR
jgi:Domain of unknown function (DUF4157)